MNKDRNIQRRQALRFHNHIATLAAFIACVWALPTNGGDASRPNILVILMDDLRADALHCAGHPFVDSPNIDRIAKEGITFSNAFVTTPLCLPSRASFLTGQYAHTHRVQVRGAADNLALSHRMITFPALLQKAGYESGYFGKWHIGNDDNPRPGFDRWGSFVEQGEYENPQLNIDGNRINAKGYLTDILTDFAVDFIRKPRDRPFVAYLCHKAVHAPFIPAARHRDKYSDIPIHRADSAHDSLDGKPVLRRPGVELSEQDPDVSSSDDLIRDQLRCLQAVDEGIGRILSALEETGQLDNTVVIFTSDHGYFWGEHDLGGKHGPYEEALRIPLLIRYPPLIKSGTRCNSMVLNIDVALTCLELAGSPAPTNMQGHSMVPLFADDRATIRDAFLAEYFYNPGQTPRFPTWQVLRTERWKYIRYPDEQDSDELYDLESDKLEMNNLIDDPMGQQIRGQLQHQLQQLLDETKYAP